MINLSGPRISIVDVTFSGLLQMPTSDQDQIADSIKQHDYGNSLAGLIDDAVERVKAGWQDRGYFKVQVSGGERMLSSSPGSQRIAITFQVEEGLQYSLGEIMFKNNRGLTMLPHCAAFSRSTMATFLAVNRSRRDWRISAEHTETEATLTLPASLIPSLTMKRSRSPLTSTWMRASSFMSAV